MPSNVGLGIHHEIYQKADHWHRVVEHCGVANGWPVLTLLGGPSVDQTASVERGPEVRSDDELLKKGNLE